MDTFIRTYMHACIQPCIHKADPTFNDISSKRNLQSVRREFSRVFIFRELELKKIVESNDAGGRCGGGWTKSHMMQGGGGRGFSPPPLILRCCTQQNQAATWIILHARTHTHTHTHSHSHLYTHTNTQELCFRSRWVGLDSFYTHTHTHTHAHVHTHGTHMCMYMYARTYLEQECGQIEHVLMTHLSVTSVASVLQMSIEWDVTPFVTSSFAVAGGDGQTHTHRQTQRDREKRSLKFKCFEMAALHFNRWSPILFLEGRMLVRVMRCNSDCQKCYLSTYVVYCSIATAKIMHCILLTSLMYCNSDCQKRCYICNVVLLHL